MKTNQLKAARKIRYLALLMVLTLISTQAWGTDTEYSFASSLPTGWTVSKGSVTSYETSSYARGACFQSASAVKLTGLSNVTKVVVTASTNKASQTIDVTVGGTALGTKTTITSGTASANAEYTFDGSTLSGDLIVNINRTNGSIWIQKIVVTTGAACNTSLTITKEGQNNGTFNLSQTLKKLLGTHKVSHSDLFSNSFSTNGVSHCILIENIDDTPSPSLIMIFRGVRYPRKIRTEGGGNHHICY